MTPHVHRRTFGSGAHPILAIHCSLAHSGAWRGLARALGPEVTLHAFDLPNHGQSGDWDGTGDIHDAATAMARQVMDEIGDGPIDVIGHSFGATVALRLAVETPGRLRRAVLFEPVFFAAACVDDPAFAAEYTSFDWARATAYAEGRLEDAARIFNRQWGGAGTWDRLPAKARTYMSDRIGFVHHSTPSLIHDSANLLGPGRMDHAHLPILLMRGALSPWATKVNHAIALRLPCATETTVAQVGHMAPVTDPEATAAPVRTFLGLTG
ncbi:alpha/beta fold hydrolase [uncultured Tateyamaria sp.]|uniref:alpha/beta fold hydrolase n=1 Tax=Tateyamaria sp. 1078 TaxID=3417464 RepID=UPI00262BD6E2|nr:alpha/beta fold hydrolase [uncultured Tateyamaria sp.]